MATTIFPYKRPGVYIKETLQPLPMPVVAPGTSVATFVGTHYMGPTTPVKITGWDQFMNLFGGFGTGRDYLPFQVYNFFANGGQAAWVLRAVSEGAGAAGAVAASVTVKNKPLDPPKSPLIPFATPLGVAPTGTGTKPAAKVSGVAFTARGTPDQTSFEVTIPYPQAATQADALQCIATPRDGSPAIGPVWIPTTAATSYLLCMAPAATGLSPGKAYDLQIVPYKGTVAGDPMTAAFDVTAKASYTPVDCFKLTAKGRGVYGNQFAVTTEASSWDPAAYRFHLFVQQKVGADFVVKESWQDVSMNPGDPRYVVSLVNSASSGSNLVTIENLLPPDPAVEGTSPTPDASWQPTVVDRAPFALGTDGTADVNLSEALAKYFGSITDVLLVNLCGRDKDAKMPGGIPSAVTINAMLAWAKTRGATFCVLDAPSVVGDAAAAVLAYTALMPAGTAQQKYAGTSLGAFYGPWVQFSDPAGASVSSSRMLAPAGAVMGQYSLADASVGPNRVAAGTAYALTGAVGVQQLFSLDQLDALNPIGVNVIRPVPQAGFCIMGARTLTQGMPDRYVSVRRMLIYLENLLEEVTRFAIFEPNGPLLWQKLNALVTQQMTAISQAGQLASTSRDQSFFVVCDETNNPPTTVANGEVHIQVGVALSSPAEFIVIEISQYQGGVSQLRNPTETPVAQ
jgi:phage tail sheath protein FI